MLLTINIGNTNIGLAVFDEDKKVFSCGLKTDTACTEDQYAVLMKSVFELNDVDSSAFSGAIISSVVPELTGVIKEAVYKLSGKNPLIVGPGIKSGLNILIDNPAQLGADLVAGAVAAIELYPLPCIVITFETALTFSVIDRKGVFRGAVIAAGLKTSLKALTERAALLHHVGIEAPPSIIGKNTVHSMQAGLTYGTAALLEGVAARIEQELNEPATLVATGKHAADIISICSREIILNQDLIFEGLRMIYNKNIKK